MTIDTIPKELKEQIISQYLEANKSEIERKLEELRKEVLKMRQEKEKYEELNK